MPRADPPSLFPGRDLDFYAPTLRNPEWRDGVRKRLAKTFRVCVIRIASRLLASLVASLDASTLLLRASWSTPRLWDPTRCLIISNKAPFARHRLPTRASPQLSMTGTCELEPATASAASAPLQAPSPVTTPQGLGAAGGPQTSPAHHPGWGPSPSSSAGGGGPRPDDKRKRGEVRGGRGTPARVPSPDARPLGHAAGGHGSRACLCACAGLCWRRRRGAARGGRVEGELGPGAQRSVLPRPRPASRARLLGILGLPRRKPGPHSL